MRSTLNESDEQAWTQLAPVLDGALNKLGETDRAALVLKFFENKSAKEIAEALRVKEDAAQKRIGRALEKLRGIFVKGGVIGSTAKIAEIISAHSVQTAPAALIKTTTAVALAKGATASVSMTALAKGAWNIMAWTKTKTVIVAGAVALLAIGTATVAVKKHQAYKAYLVALDSWRIPRFAPDTVSTALPQMRILPTKFKPPVYGQFWAAPDKWAGVRARVRDMARAAYNWPPGRVYFPAGEPTNRYDFASTLDDDAATAFQNEIKKVTGLVGHTETIDTDVFVLKVRTPDAPGLKPPHGPVNMHYDIRGRIICQGLPLSSVSVPNPSLTSIGLTKYLEIFLETPVIDETGLTNYYDIDIKWNANSKNDPEHNALKKVLLDQLGLELVPANRPVEILVMEKVK